MAFTEGLNNEGFKKVSPPASMSGVNKLEKGGDAFILGGAMGWAYEEGVEEGRRKRRKRKKSDSDDPSTID